MNAELMTKDFQRHGVRITDQNGEPWFVAKDVCDVLGYSNASDAVIKHCKSAKILTSQNATFEIPNRGLAIIPESDLYRLIMRSKMPSAEAFTDWVTSEFSPQSANTVRI
ncbi:MAG: hypothetical protein EOL87_07575 [Spartobacteria bacterium]|nr:hypothetical protein [Spartobacteria bacterium]